MVSAERLGRYGDWAEIRPSCLSGSLDGHRPFFSGSHAYERMDTLRRSINEIRATWHRYPQYMAELREIMESTQIEGIGDVDRARAEALFASVKSWADQSGGAAHGDDYSAIRLYTSDIGYRRIFDVINTALRTEGIEQDGGLMRSAAFIVELLNIDLFNYRARNPAADNFEGTVYRGMCVPAPDIEVFGRVAKAPVEERYVSIPLSMISSTLSRAKAVRIALERAEKAPGTLPMLWEIEVSGLDTALLGFYREQFPASVVTTLCAVPVERLSRFPSEREVLLRGPHFQILGLGSEESAPGSGKRIGKVRAVMLNSNRDHITAIASNEGADRRARDLFRSIVLLHRSTLCADYAEASGAARDAADYRAIAADNRAFVDAFAGRGRS